MQEIQKQLEVVLREVNKLKTMLAMPPKPQKHKKRCNLKFNMLNIPIGAELVFEPDPRYKVKVWSNDLIVYKGNKYTMSAFARLYMPNKMRNEYGAYQGSLYFSYRGENLVDLRNRLGV